jgi:hypothetical protein
MEEVKTPKPKWLRKLERESWQAELIISGAALFGSLQLPWMLEKFQHYLLLNYERASLDLWFFATSYWAIFVYGLILLFVFHFIVRALWIGLVGLNSIYPDGIVETTLSSKDYQQKMEAEYGDIDGFIDRLDRMASGMFGTGFAFIGLFFNLGLFMSLAILLLTFLQRIGVPDFWAWFIGLSPVVLTFTLSIFTTVLNLPKFRERAWVKRYHFPLSKFMTHVSYPINTRYTATGMILVSSNGAPKEKQGLALLKSFAMIIVASFLLGILMGVTGAIKPQFMDHFYHRMGDDETSIDLSNYADTGYEGVLYEPLLSARYPRADGPLWVWVPLPERELSIMLDLCSQPEVDDELPRAKERKAERKRLVACTGEYVELFLDDQPLKLPPALREYRDTEAVTEQFGVRFDLSGHSPIPGQHVLKVVTRYPLDDETDFRTTYISFFVMQDGDDLPAVNVPSEL